MFVFSVKAGKTKIALCFGVIISIIIISLFIFNPVNSYESKTAQVASIRFNTDANDNNEIIKFLSQFGWQTSSEPISTKDISIPTVFNDTYEKYNQIQKSQGMDLKKYMGKLCKQYTYDITNYEGCDQNVRANVLVIDGKVIGGDISSTNLDGFMHGFEKPQDN